MVRKELLKTALVSLRMSDRQLLEEVNILAMAITGVSIIDSEMMNKYYPEDEKQHD
ncbi:MAG: hypothetical protein DSM107014_12925 [Gomphosphaeria aponina SAG 52.96 = DSM 107014]|uniref:Uncharacterized protein n=1 Tax=Gomphosphaeria aponina SAG 52.96 = DSM 107014 TaxID=1521640 RepID=A0A941GWE2_9CHRO|nr:hypothetical protein [Gomphosphaeria aponina SAG 52.96 = DSM 107014]